MTVSTIGSIAEFATNGVTTNYPFFFKFLANEDLVVTYVNPLGVSTTLILGTNYTVSGAGSESGGSIVTTSALAGPGQLVVSRVMDAFQQTSLRNQGKFLAETHEDVFDRLTMLIQQGIANSSRAISRPYGRDYFYGEGRRITSVADPIDNQDVANRQFVTAYVASILSAGQGPQNNAFNVVYSDGNSVGQIIRDKMITVVDSIAALRNVLKVQYTHCFVSGYEPGTAGGGQYEYDAADTTSADNGGTIIVATDGGRWKLKFQQFVTVEQFGVLPVPGRNNFARLAVACAYGYTNKVSIRAGVGVFEYGTTWDLSYPGLDLRGIGMDATVFKYTGASRAATAVGDRPNNGSYSVGLNLEDFKIEGNANATDLLLIRIHHSKLKNINFGEASTVAGCALRIQGCVAAKFDNVVCSTNLKLMASRPQNGIILEADPTNGGRASCNLFINPIMEGLTGDGIVFKAADQGTMIGGTSENSDGSGISIFAGCQINTFIGLGQENRGFADIYDGGIMNKFINCYGNKLVAIGASSVMSKIEGGYFEKIDVDVGASRPTVSGVKVKFFGGTGGLVHNNNTSLKAVDIYDQAAGAYIFPKVAGRVIVIGATPFTYTNNTVRSEAITVVGTGISSLLLKRDGTTVGSVPAPGTYWLQPGDGLTATYTGAVNMWAMPGGVD